jgi:hypothetical protein
MITMSNYKYIRMDADKIGDNIELALLEENISKATEIHSSVQLALKQIKEKLSVIASLEFLMVGCDDILYRIDSGKFNIETIKSLKEFFFTATGHTLSFGVGESLNESLLNLRKSKYKGGNTITGI